VPVVFSALPTAEARELEPQFAAAGYAVITNASAYRMAEDVPLSFPEINPEHTALIPRQQEKCGWPGFIVASPNCSTTSAVLPLHIFQQAFGLEAALITTMQAISGAGYPGAFLAWTSSTTSSRTSPGEDEKLEQEPKKLLGRMSNGSAGKGKLAAQRRSNTRARARWPSRARLRGLQAKPPQRRRLTRSVPGSHRCHAASLPSSPERVLVYRPEPDRPAAAPRSRQRKRLAWTVGNVRACPSSTCATWR
jgi:aspartate-semialdehyde dehydrogenase